MERTSNSIIVGGLCKIIREAAASFTMAASFFSLSYLQFLRIKHPLMNKFSSIVNPVSTLLLLALAIGCREEDNAKLPVVATLSTNNVTSVSAEVVGLISTTEGNADVTNSGVCWSTTSEPALNGSGRDPGAPWPASR